MFAFVITFLQNMFAADTTLSNHKQTDTSKQGTLARQGTKKVTQKLASQSYKAKANATGNLRGFERPSLHTVSTATVSLVDKPTIALPANVVPRLAAAPQPYNHNFSHIVQPLIKAMQQAPIQHITMPQMANFATQCQLLSNEAFRQQVKKLMQDKGYEVRLCSDNDTDFILLHDQNAALVRTINHPLSMANMMIKPTGIRHFTALHQDAVEQGFTMSMIFTSGRINLCSRDFAKSHRQFSLDGKALIKMTQPHAVTPINTKPEAQYAS